MPGINMIFTIIFSFLINIAGDEQITDKDWHLVKELKSEWMVYDEDNNLYAPYIENEHSHFRVVNLNLELDRYKGCYFSLLSQSGISVFIDNKLVGYYPEGVKKNYSIDSLISISVQEQVFITVFLVNGNLLNVDANILSHNPGNLNSSYQDTFHPTYLLREQYRNFLVVSLIVILFLYAVSINIDRRVFMIYLDVSAFLKRSSWDDYLISQRTINNVDVLNINQVIATGSFLLVLMIIFRNTSVNIFESDFSLNLLLLWLGFFALTAFWFIMKFLLIRLMTKLLQLKEIQNIHFYEYIRLNNIFVLLAFVLFQISYFAFDIPIGKLSALGLGAFTIFVIFRIIALYMKFLSSTTHKKVYLFSYLCTTEIIPALISVKFLYSTDQAVWF